MNLFFLVQSLSADVVSLKEKNYLADVKLLAKGSSEISWLRSTWPHPLRRKVKRKIW